MNISEFAERAGARLLAAGGTIGEDGIVSIPMDAFARLLSQNNSVVIERFVRMQRRHGVRTVQYAAAAPINRISRLADHLGDDVLLDEDIAMVAQVLQNSVVDISSEVGENLRLICDGA